MQQPVSCCVCVSSDVLSQASYLLYISSRTTGRCERRGWGPQRTSHTQAFGSELPVGTGYLGKGVSLPGKWRAAP
eukprot:6667077-Prymnesium_polylepis.1